MCSAADEPFFVAGTVCIVTTMNRTYRTRIRRCARVVLVSDPVESGVNLNSLGSAGLTAPSQVYALDPTDSEQPRVQSYSLTVAERMPWNSVLEVAYVGNKADYLSNYNNNFSQINDLGVGACLTAAGKGGCQSSQQQTNDRGRMRRADADTATALGTSTAARPLWAVLRDIEDSQSRDVLELQQHAGVVEQAGGPLHLHG